MMRRLINPFRAVMFCASQRVHVQIRYGLLKAQGRVGTATAQMSSYYQSDKMKVYIVMSQEHAVVGMYTCSTLRSTIVAPYDAIIPLPSLPPVS